MLIFRNDTTEKMYVHAENEYPKECCGVLLGRRLGDERIAEKVIPAGNTADDSHRATHFSMDPLEFLKVEVLAEKENLEIIGFYHSHPEYEATASGEDVLHMIAGYSYPIISVKNGSCVWLNSFERINQTDTQVKIEVLEGK